MGKRCRKVETFRSISPDGRDSAAQILINDPRVRELSSSFWGARFAVFSCRIAAISRAHFLLITCIVARARYGLSLQIRLKGSGSRQIELNDKGDTEINGVLVTGRATYTGNREKAA